MGLNHDRTSAFVADNLRNQLVHGTSRKRRVARSVVLCISYALFIRALARPQWGSEEEPSYSKGRTVMLAIDASRSMLAQDLTPSRLDRAKLAAYDLIEALPEDLIDRLNEVTTTQVQKMTEPIVWENKEERKAASVRRLSKILDRDPVYLEAATYPAILDAIEGYIGPNIEMLTNKHNHIMVRPPGSCPVPWHSGEEPWEPTLITALIYLEESTMDNGCVHIVPGSHVRPFSRKRRPSGDWASSK